VAQQKRTHVQRWYVGTEAASVVQHRHAPAHTTSTPSPGITPACHILSSRQGQNHGRRRNVTCLNWLSGRDGCGTVHCRQTLPSILWKYCHSCGSPIAPTSSSPMAGEPDPTGVHTFPHEIGSRNEGVPAGSRDVVGECCGVAGRAPFSRTLCGGLCASASIRGRIFLRRFYANTFCPDCMQMGSLAWPLRVFFISCRRRPLPQAPGVTAAASAWARARYSILIVYYI